jgi:hypothetical protein
MLYDNKMRLKNEYGVNDPTAYNAIMSIQNPNFIIMSGNNVIEPPQGKLNKSEVLFEMEKLIGKPLHRNTMRLWEKQKLIPEGYKFGKEKFYHKYTPHEGLASWLLLHGPLKTDHRMASAARRIALSIDENNAEEILSPFGTIVIDEDSPYIRYEQMMEATYNGDPKKAFAYFWLRYKVLSVAKLDPLDYSIRLTSIRKANVTTNEKYKYVIEVD